MKKRRALFFIAIILSLWGGLIACKKGAPKSPLSEMVNFPCFSGNDVYGNKLISKQYLGACLYVQFIDPKHKEQIVLLNNVVKDYGDIGLNILLLHLPRIEIIEVNEEGKIIGHFYYKEITDIINYGHGFVARKNENRIRFYLTNSAGAELYILEAGN